MRIRNDSHNEIKIDCTVRFPPPPITASIVYIFRNYKLQVKLAAKLDRYY